MERTVEGDGHETGHIRDAIQGKCGTEGGCIGVIKASTSAPSCTLTSHVGPGGVSGSLQTIAGGTASFESEVMLIGDTSFTEAGTIRFGDSNHSLRFSTVGQGFLGESADSAVQQTGFPRFCLES
jgi:hypothetical protein